MFSFFATPYWPPTTPNCILCNYTHNFNSIRLKFGTIILIYKLSAFLVFKNVVPFWKNRISPTSPTTLAPLYLHHIIHTTLPTLHYKHTLPTLHYTHIIIFKLLKYVCEIMKSGIILSSILDYSVLTNKKNCLRDFAKSK